MLIERDRQQEVFQTEKWKDAYFFDMMYGEYTCGSMAVVLLGDGACTAHFDVPRWTRDIGHTILQDWEKVVRILKDRELDEIVITNDNLEDERRWGKFISLFGFPAPTKILMSQRSL